MAPEIETRRFHTFMACIVTMLVCADLLLTHVVRLSGMSELRNQAFGITMMLAVLFYCRYRNSGRLKEMAAVAIWAILLTNFLSILIQTAGRTSAPLLDSELARLDSSLHFSTVAVVSWLHGFPKLRIGLLLSYNLLVLFIVAALFVPTLQSRHEYARRFILAVVISGIATAAIFAVCPAVGPWTVYPFKPAGDQIATQAYLLLLKSGQPAAMNFKDCGVVSFPSFHVVLALLCPRALWYSRWRWLAALIALAICISTVTTGWHYVTDVIGGIAVAAMSQAAAARVLVWLSTAFQVKTIAPTGEYAGPATVGQLEA
jgi:membrane-associated phospholipid phosphatase